MEWWAILLLILIIPIILFPAVLIWYINTSGIYTVIRETRRRRATLKKRAREALLAEQQVLK